LGGSDDRVAPPLLLLVRKRAPGFALGQVSASLRLSTEGQLS
jgi:hypothetical protein